GAPTPPAAEPTHAPTAPAPAPAPAPEPSPEPARATEPAPEPAPIAETAPAPAPEPQQAAPAPAPSGDGVKPALLSAPRGGQADDLKRIRGIGPGLEKELNAAGVYHIDQIAAWSAEEVAWADQNLVRFKGRVSRDDWVGQARQLDEGGETDFSRKVDKGGVYE
ncbi:MAG: hypothetical protein JJU40_02330, partial [Rhodobacteraceae bacterium]|nr:hypothetical protein [Paracoccaceae bacterium]